MTWATLSSREVDQCLVTTALCSMPGVQRMIGECPSFWTSIKALLLHETTNNLHLTINKSPCLTDKNERLMGQKADCGVKSFTCEPAPQLM